MSNQEEVQPEKPAVSDLPTVPADAPTADSDTLGAGIDFADPNSPLAFLYLRTVHIVAILTLTVFFVFLTHPSVWHTDIWGHMRFGEYIVVNRHLPEHEMFSGDFADQDAAYINYQWLAQAGAYLVFDLGRRLAGPTADARLGGGALMLATVHSLIVAVRLFVLLFVFRRLTGSTRAGLVGIVLVFGMSLPCHLRILRPQILGELAFAVLLLPLSRPVLSRRALFLIPILFVVWANTHGSFLMGFVLLGAFLVGRAAQLLWENRSFQPLRSDAQLWRLGAVLIASLGAVALLNPHGPALYWHLAQLSRHVNLPFLEEWKPVPFQQATGYVFLGSVLFLLPLLRWSPVPFTATQLLLLLGFGVETLEHVRVFVWWIMVFAWVAVPHLYALCRRWRLFFAEEPDKPDLRKTILAALGTVVLLLWSAPAQWFVFGEAPSGIRRVTPTTPVKAVAYLKKQYTEHPELSRCVFTSETVGEFVLWDLRLTPPVRVFCYTHVHLLTPVHWQECLRVKNADPGWEAILDRHGVAFLVVEPDLHPRLAKQVREAPEHWEIVPDMAPLLVARRLPPAEKDR